ncbi:MAG: lipocalin family protein [Acidobacteria bacterium]|nr:lipocalin family protein [Acidobacteriota bacterium]
MKMKNLLMTFMCLIAAGTTFANTGSTLKSGDDGKVKAVDSVDLKRYAGKWYEIARYPNRFQKKCAGNVTATYSLKDNGRINVLNECIKQNGEKMDAEGEAKIVDKRSNSKLKVRFAPGWLSWLPFVWGDYWILDLDEDYRYAVIGDPSRDYLWILSRDPKLDDAAYDGILARVKEMGFEPGRLVKTPQDQNRK